MRQGTVLLTYNTKVIIRFKEVIQHPDNPDNTVKLGIYYVLLGGLEEYNREEYNRDSLGSSYKCNSFLKTSCGVKNPRVFRGRSFSISCAFLMFANVTFEKSVPLGKNWRIKALVFSLVPRSQGEWGCAK